MNPNERYIFSLEDQLDKAKARIKELEQLLPLINDANMNESMNESLLKAKERIKELEQLLPFINDAGVNEAASMEKFLKQCLLEKPEIAKCDEKNFLVWKYKENISKDALTEDWLQNHTSYIYKVGVLCAIDYNKCDYAYIAIGTQQDDKSKPELKGYFNFGRGENDDMGRTIKRALNCLSSIHPAFDPE